MSEIPTYPDECSHGASRPDMCGHCQLGTAKARIANLEALLRRHIDGAPVPRPNPMLAMIDDVLKRT